MGFFSDDELDTPVGKESDVVQKLQEDKVLPPQQEAQPEDNIPPEYRGKSIEDIIKMHSEAKQVIGRQGNELGLARQMTQRAAELLERQSKADNGSPSKREDADQENPDAAFFASPRQTVEKTISEHPDVQAAVAMARQTASEKALSRVQENIGSDPRKIVTSQEFGEWVTSSQWRLEAFQKANAQADADAATNIIKMYQYENAEKLKAQEAQKQAVSQQSKSDMKAMQVDAGTPAAPERGRIYSRLELQKLLRNKPDEYAANETEIMKAYAEGRVK